MSAIGLFQRLALASPRATYAVSGALVLLSVAAFARARIVTDVTEIVKTPAARAFQTTARVFGLNQRAFLLVEADRAGREEQLVRCGRELARRLPRPGLIDRVELGLPLDPDAFSEKLVPFGPLYFSPGSLPELERLFTPGGLREQLDKQASRMNLMGLGMAEEWAERDPLELGRALIARARTLEGGYRMRPGSPYLLSEDGRALLVVVVGDERAQGIAATKEVVGALSDASRAILAEPWAAGLSIRGTGTYYFAEESERIVRGDMILSMSTSMLLCAAIMAFGLRVWSPLTAARLIAPTLVGTVVAMGLFAAIRPAFSAIAIGSAAILIGLGSDYSVHVACAAFDLRAKGASPRDAVLDAIGRTFSGSLGSTLTSVAVFLCYQASDQTFLVEMGLLTAAGLLACWLASVLLLPPILLGIMERDPTRSDWTPRSLGATTCARAGVARPGVAIALSLALSGLAAAQLGRAPIRLEDDLRNIHARGSEPLAVQERIARVFGGSHEPITILIEGKDEDEVVAASQRLEPGLSSLLADGTLVARTSIAPLLPPREDQERAIAVLAKLDPARVRADLVQALDGAGFDPSRFDGYVARVGSAVAAREPLTCAWLRAIGLGPVVDRFVTTSEGRAYGLVLAHPKSDLWDSAVRADVGRKLDSALRDARVPGALASLYLISDESASAVSRDFLRIAGLSIVGVLLVVIVQFRRPGRIALVNAAPALGILWTAGLFSFFDYRLNLMNLGVLPMLYGVGIDDGIYPVERWYGGGFSSVIDVYRFKGGAMMMCMLTTMVSFGSLALSQNRGISSLGVLTFLGIGLCLFTSLTSLPAVLEVVRRRSPGPS